MLFPVTIEHIEKQIRLFTDESQEKLRLYYFADREQYAVFAYNNFHEYAEVALVPDKETPFENILDQFKLVHPDFFAQATELLRKPFNPLRVVGEFVMRE